jgi:hypothetical protein
MRSFSSAEGCSHRPRSERQNTFEWGISSVFLSLCPHPDGCFEFTSFATGYLEKGARELRVTLKQGEQENSFGQYSSLRKQFEIGTSGSLTARTYQGQATIHKDGGRNSGG